MAVTLQRAHPQYFGSTINKEPLMVGGPEYTHFKETASQVYKAGDLVYLDTNGTVALLGLTNTVQANTKIAGQALTDASGVTGANVYFRAIAPTDLYVMNVMHGTAASAVTVLTQLGAVFGIRRDTVSGNGTLVWGVDIENAVTTTSSHLARVKVVGFPLKNPFDAGNLVRPAIGDVYGLVIVQFIMGNSNSDGNTSAQGLLQMAG